MILMINKLFKYFFYNIKYENIIINKIIIFLILIYII